MKKQTLKDIQIHTEKEIMQLLVIGRPYRPNTSSILLIKEGYLEVSYNLTHYKLTPLTIFHVNPMLVYEFKRVDPKIQMRVITLDPNFESFSAIKIRRYESRSFFISTIQNHYSVAPLEFKELWSTFEILRGRLASTENGIVKKELIHHLFLSIIYLLADISEKYNQIKTNELSRSDYLLLNFTKLVTVHFRTERTVSFYASRLSISPKHLSETSKSSSGFTAGEIINQAILIEAKILLANPSFTINQVALELNFSDQYAFSKFFKRLTQMTPSTYKEKF